MAERLLSPAEARAFYDWFGHRQDWQRFYEDPATADLVANAAFGAAQAVVEFGCGTGRLAESVLVDHLPSTARYLAVDISPTMVGLARERLARFGKRVEVRQTAGEPTIAADSGSFDRFLSTYVLDLLPEAAIHSLLAEAQRLLSVDGRLVLVSLTHGTTPLLRLVERAWVALHRVRPAWLGGCRPIGLGDFVDRSRWHVRHHRQITRYGLSSDVLVAEKLPGRAGEGRDGAG